VQFLTCASLAFFEGTKLKSLLWELKKVTKTKTNCLLRVSKIYFVSARASMVRIKHDA